jgi:hypothetical protein
MIPSPPLPEVLIKKFSTFFHFFRQNTLHGKHYILGGQIHEEAVMIVSEGP